MILHTLSCSHRATDPTWKHLGESVSHWENRRQRFCFNYSRASERNRAGLCQRGLGLICVYDDVMSPVCKSFAVVVYVCNFVLFSLAFTVDAFSFAPEANLRSPRDVKDLQGGEGCEKSRRKQCNPCYSEVGTSGAWAPAGPHPGTGTVKSQKTPFVIPSVHSR